SFSPPTSGFRTPSNRSCAIRNWRPSKCPASALWLFSVALLLATGVAAVRGQSARDGFDPNANNLVLALVVQSDGKILIGGGFSALSPNGEPAVTRNRIARLNPNGTLDTTF